MKKTPSLLVPGTKKLYTILCTVLGPPLIMCCVICHSPVQNWQNSMSSKLEPPSQLDAPIFGVILLEKESWHTTNIKAAVITPERYVNYHEDGGSSYDAKTSREVL
jgi:hypothetical protein